jgi:hypothetical protein
MTNIYAERMGQSMTGPDIIERLRWSISADTPARYPDLIKEAIAEIERARASALIWRTIAKYNSEWNRLPKTEKEAALVKALESAIAETVQQLDQIDRLREENTRLRGS